MKTQKSPDDIEETALRLRELLGVERPNAPYLITIIDKLPNVIPEFKYERCFDEKMPEAPAMADCSTKTIFVRESLHQDLLKAEPRARMTIAHEIGHIVLGHEGNRFRKDLKGNVFGREKTEEREANIFAARFLMPTSQAKVFVTAIEIAEKFQVSQMAAEIRFKELSFDKGRKIPDKTMELIEEMRKRWR